jgi:hypothetical protein
MTKIAHYAVVLEFLRIPETSKETTRVTNFQFHNELSRDEFVEDARKRGFVAHAGRHITGAQA